MIGFIFKYIIRIFIYSLNLLKRFSGVQKINEIGLIKTNFVSSQINFSMLINNIWYLIKISYIIRNIVHIFFELLATASLWLLEEFSEMSALLRILGACNSIVAVFWRWFENWKFHGCSAVMLKILIHNSFSAWEFFYWTTFRILRGNNQDCCSQWFLKLPNFSYTRNRKRIFERLLSCWKTYFYFWFAK